MSKTAAKATAKAAGYMLVTTAFGVTGPSLLPGDFHRVIAIVALVLFVMMVSWDCRGYFVSDKDSRAVTRPKTKRRRPPKKRNRKRGPRK